MSDNNKYRLFALALGVVICFNVIVSNYRETYAVSGVEGYVIRQVLESYMMSMGIAAGQSDEAAEARASIVDSFLNVYIDEAPDDYDDWSSFDRVLYSLDHPTSVALHNANARIRRAENGEFVILSPSELLQKLCNDFATFIFEHNYDVDTHCISAPTVSSGSVSDFESAYYRIESFVQSYCGFTPGIASLTQDRSGYSASYARNLPYFTVLLDTVDNYPCVYVIQGREDYFDRCRVRVLGGQEVYYGDNPYLTCFSNSSYYPVDRCKTSSTILDQFTIDPEAGAAAVSGPFPYNGDLFENIPSGVNNFVAAKSASIVTHNADGSEDVLPTTVFTVAVREEVDDQGNTHYVPYLPDEAAAAGVSLDDIFSKPTDNELEKFPTVADSDVKAVSGTVSVTGFQRFGAVVTSSMVAHTDILTDIRNGVFSIPSYVSILGSIKDSIPDVIDYTDILTGISTGISSIAYPAVDDNTNIFSQILGAILGISIPDPTTTLERVFVPDLTNIINLKPQIQSKFGFASQFKQLWITLLNGELIETKVEFTFQLPSFFRCGAVTCKLVDFASFDVYRQWFHYLIILFAYLSFAKRCYYSLPTLLGYVGADGGSRVVINNFNNS